MEGKKTTQEEYQKCVNAVVDYINLHLGEEIDLKSLARISHFSPFYFHRIMKAFLGEPIGTFIVRTRIEAAPITLFINFHIRYCLSDRICFSIVFFQNIQTNVWYLSNRIS